MLDTHSRSLQLLHHSYVQIDLSAQPEQRGAMLAGSDNNTRLPQLHVNGQVSSGMLVATPVTAQCSGMLQW
jgi:hypothetical protein